jgi:hypothetical protein
VGISITFGTYRAIELFNCSIFSTANYMNQSRFLLSLGTVSGCTAIGLFLLNRLPGFQIHALFAWGTFAFFVLFTLLAFWYGSMAARSTNKHQFTNAFMVLTMIKMLFSLMIIVGYFFLAKPANKLFIVPFFGIYLIYTIFETALLMRLGRSN